MIWRGAISGFGEMAARAHLPGWQARDDIRIVAIHDPVSARRYRALNLMPRLRVYDDLELMLDAEGLDFIDIASPPAIHAAAAQCALEAGVNVLVEKPLCLNPAELSELTALARDRQRLLMCVHNWKHAPVYRKAHQLIELGHLGNIQYLGLQRTRTRPAGESDTPGWRLARDAGGGIMIDHGWHAFYLAQWLMAGRMPRSVSARLGFDSTAAVDDLADLRIEFPDGRLACVHLSWRAPVRRTTATIYGSEGMVEIEGPRLVLSARSGAVEHYQAPFSTDDSYHSAWFASVASDFAQALAEGPQSDLVRVNLGEAEAAVGLVAAASESALSGREVQLTRLE